jgi:membrane protease YdiL (CAAX protease family)
VLVGMEHVAVGTTCDGGVIMFLSQMPWDFTLIFAFLLIVIPWRGRVRLRRLLSIDLVGSKEKITLYATTIAFQWIMAMVVAWRALARGLTPAELGLSPVGWTRMLLPSLVGAIVLGGLHWLNLRRVGKMDGLAADLMRSLGKRILPNSFLEMLPYFALAVTAGVCEEFLYRGFGMAALSHVGLPTWMVVLLTSLLFGLAHTYQGKSGVVGTSLLGMVLGGFRVLLQSIVPLSVWHTTVDLVAGIAGRKYLMSDVTELKEL